MNLKRTKQVIWGLVVLCALFAALLQVTESTVIGVLMLVCVAGIVAVTFFFWRCPYCGTHLGLNVRHFCTHCGKELPDWANL